MCAYLHEKRANCICSNEVNRYEKMRQTDKWKFNHLVRIFLMPNIFSHYWVAVKRGGSVFGETNAGLRMNALIIERSHRTRERRRKINRALSNARGKKKREKKNEWLSSILPESRWLIQTKRTLLSNGWFFSSHSKSYL